MSLAGTDDLPPDPLLPAQPVPPQTPEPPESRYWTRTPWSLWWGLGAAVLIMGLVFLVMMLGGGAIYALNPGAIQTGGTTVKIDFRNPAIAYGFVGVMLGAQMLGVALTVAYASMHGGQLRDVLALRKPYGGVSAYAWAVPAFVVFGFAAGALVQWLSPQSNQADTQMMVQLTRSPAWWLILIVAAVGAPLQEELMFRGFLFSTLARSRLRFIGTAIVSSIAWAAIHGYSLQGDATIFGLGLALSFILWRTGSTRVTMLCHGSYNALAFVAASFVPVSGG